MHQHGPNDEGNPSTRANTNQTSGIENRSSARPPFPTVAGAQGIRHGRAPRVLRIKGLVPPDNLGKSIEILTPAQSQAQDDRYRSAAFSGVM